MSQTTINPLVALSQAPNMASSVTHTCRAGGGSTHYLPQGERQARCLLGRAHAGSLSLPDSPSHVALAELFSTPTIRQHLCYTPLPSKLPISSVSGPQQQAPQWMPGPLG